MPTTHQPAPIEHIVEAWKQGATLQDIAEAAGVSRQRISQRLIEAGYSPAQRRARAASARAGEHDAYKQQRAATLAVRADERDAACERFIALCHELAVSPQTLGQYVARAGTYANDVKPVPGRYGRGKLPGRQTTAGKLTAQRARDAAAPWSARHIASLVARRRT